MRIVALLVLTASVVGCGGHPDREPLIQFVHALEAPIKASYEDQLRGVTKEERKVRFPVLLHRAQVAAIDEYLAGDPALTPRGRAAVDAVRQTCVERAELYEGLIREGRSQLTADEERRAAELMTQFHEQLARIGRMIDGKE